MVLEEIKSLLDSRFGEGVIETLVMAQPTVRVPSHLLPEICSFLLETPNLYFDTLSCITAIDSGPVKQTIEVIYSLYSIIYHHQLHINVLVSREPAEEAPHYLYEGKRLPIIPTVCTIWHTANWHEREAFDLVGVGFEGHPDLRRILLPADWQGHPLRKDYDNLETYHGIKVSY